MIRRNHPVGCDRSRSRRSVTMGPDPRPVTRLDRTRRVVRVGDSDDPNERRRRFRPCVRASVRACVGAIDRGSALRRSFVRVVRPRRSFASFASFVRIVRAGRSIDRPIGRSPWGPSSSSSSRFPRGRRRAGADANGASTTTTRTDARRHPRRGIDAETRTRRRAASGVSTALKKKTERALGRGCAHPSIQPFVRSSREERVDARKRSDRRTFGATVRRTVFFAVVARLVSGRRPVFKARATMIIFVRAWIGVRDVLGTPVSGRTRSSGSGRWNFQLALHYGTLSISRKNVKNVRRPERPRVKSPLIRASDRSFQRSKSDGGV